MFNLVKYDKKKTKIPECDYYFEDFEEFYELASVITMSFKGMINVAIISNDTKAVLGFIRKSSMYNGYNINVYTNNDTIKHINKITQVVVEQEQKSMFVILQEMCSEANLLFAKNVQLDLYNSIEHDLDTFKEIVNVLLTEFGERNEITKSMLASVVVLNNTIYPREVLISFIFKSRYRQSKLKSCLSSVSKEIAYYATKKQVADLLRAKCQYYKTGEGNNLIKVLPSNTLNYLFYLFYASAFSDIKDLEVIYEIYERDLV